MFYKLLFYYLLIKISIYKVLGKISVVTQGISPLEKDSIGIKFFVDIVNENRIGTCKVYSRVEKCCLTDLDEEDCRVIEVVGASIDMVKSRDRKTLLYVYPTLYPYDLVGYCNFILNYHCYKDKNRLHVTIPFDTKVVNGRSSNPLLKSYLSSANSVVCETLDQDSLDNCYPIDCDAKYFGKRSFYDENIKRCSKTPVCMGDVDKELPGVVYVPRINVCKDLEYPFTAQDIYTITTGLGIVNMSTEKEDDLKVEFKSNCSTISQNLYLLKDMLNGKLCPCDNCDSNVFEDGCKSAILAIVFCVLSMCAVLLSFVFCVNTTVWVHRQWYNGNISNFMVKVKSRFTRAENKVHSRASERRSRVNSQIRNKLLREVITKDVPLELRDSVVSICDRMEKEIREKKRYRREDIGSQISLQKEDRVVMTSSSSSETLCSEKDALIK